MGSRGWYSLVGVSFLHCFVDTVGCVTT